MIDLEPIVRTTIPGDLVADVARRDVAIWLPHGVPEDEHISPLVDILRLPWRMVLLETSNSKLIDLLSEEQAPSALVRSRGYVQVIDGNPSHISLPERSLPVYLLSGLAPTTDPFQARLQRMMMLDQLLQSGVRRLFIMSPAAHEPLPPDLYDLHTAGFRATVIVASNNPSVESSLLKGASRVPLPLMLIRNTVAEISRQLTALYQHDHADQGTVVKVRRNTEGDTSTLDVADIDDPERPVLSRFKAIQVADLVPLLPEELSAQAFTDFFRDPSSSWQPYAAGLPWHREVNAKKKVLDLLREVEIAGPDQNAFATVISESGSGGTTFAHDVAWYCATHGYPVLVAEQSPFAPDSLAVSNLLNQARHHGDRSAGDHPPYEAPWLFVFDRLHWEHGQAELRSFFRDIKRLRRPVCVLAVTGPRRGLAALDGLAEKPIANLTHTLSLEEARTLGRHLNRFLRVHGRTRSERDWDNFHSQHSVGVDFSMFWIALSFWIRDRYDLTETIQERLFQTFTRHVEDIDVQQAILDIAALSAERVPTPERILVTPKGKPWPVPRLLEDIQPDLGDLGLFEFKVAGERHWALVHDILGQQLLNALFRDHRLRHQLGFAAAREPVDLRLMILTRIATRGQIGHPVLRDLGERFATSIFKIDPDHGRATFVQYWRDVVSALDGMPQSLQMSSRVFRHHTAISRRRIAKLSNPIYDVAASDQETLLRRAILDVEYAIESIRFERGGETDLNLYNTVAHAYFDLADLLAKESASDDDVGLLRQKGNEAARRVFDDNPTNSFAIETYVRNLLLRAERETDRAAEFSVEALGILFSALISNERAYRMASLERLADQAVGRLFGSAERQPERLREPLSALDVLVNAWIVLTFPHGAAAFEEVSRSAREEALRILAHEQGRGNPQVVKLAYELMSLNSPYEFRRQLELVQELQGQFRSTSPQLRLEYAVLLYQVGQAVQGNDEFFELRRLWRERDYIVEVPQRLQLLRAEDGVVKTVRATAVSNESGRPMAAVQEFQGRRAPFRPEEFGFREPRAGTLFRCRVTFGHNGPLLRPAVATRGADG